MATVTPLPPTAKSTAERMFPQLTPAQIARVAAHGRTRTMQQGEVLFDVGDPAVQFLLVLSGQIESEPIYGDGKAGPRIADILSRVEISLDKRIAY